MDTLKNFLMDLVIKYGNESLSSKSELKKLEQELSAYFARQRKIFGNSDLTEEIDFEGLERALTESLSVEIEMYFFGLPEEREQALATILSKAESFDISGNGRVKHLVESTLDIVLNFCWNHMDPEHRFMMNQMSKILKEHSRPQPSFVDQTALPGRKPTAGEVPIQPLGNELIVENQEMLRNEVLLPWMRWSPSYRAVFPQVYVEPVIYGVKKGGEVSLQKLMSECLDKNLVFTGDAGAGKTTLLRHIYLEENPDYRFLYLKAGALLKEDKDLSPYERGVITLLFSALAGQPAMPKVLLLDEMDEAFVDSPEALKEKLSILFQKSPNISIWFGWRAEHFYQKLTPELQSFLYNIMEVRKWDDTINAAQAMADPGRSMILSYVRKYEEALKISGLYDCCVKMMEENEKVYEIAKTPLHLTLILYLLDSAKRSGQKELALNVENLYSLYNQFFLCWVKREHGRGTSTLHLQDIRGELQNIARTLYYGKDCLVSSKDTAITDLLVFSYCDQRNAEKIAVEFCHRSFCAFFYADKIFQGMRGDASSLIDVLDQPQRNDVTDFVREAIETVKYTDDLSEFQHRMMKIYSQTEHRDQKELDQESYEKIRRLSPMQLLYLQDELIYFITRLPLQRSDVPEFIGQAYTNTVNPFLRLDLAYGAVLTGPSWVGLDYAKSLEPGSDTDLMNRSWSLAFFGDVLANPYFYKDLEEVPWKKTREARLKRFRSDKWKALRFRILDLPLMYCFYVNRNWRDVNETDFEVIKNVLIEHPIFTEEEKCFLRKKKGQLVREYEEHMKRGVLRKNSI